MGNINLRDKLSAARLDDSDQQTEYTKISIIHILEIIVLSAFVWFMITVMMQTVAAMNEVMFEIFNDYHSYVVPWIKNHYLFFLFIFAIAVLRSIFYRIKWFEGAFGDGATCTVNFFHDTYKSNKTIDEIKSELQTLPSFTSGLKRLFITVLTIGAGGSGGLEGPGIPIGESFGRGFAKLFKINSVERFRIYQMCGIAAAISTLLHAPLTGCIFACELVFAGHFIYQFIIYSMLASLTAFILSNHLLDHAGLILVHVAHGQAYSINEYLYIILSSCIVSIPSGIGLILVLKIIKKILSQIPVFFHAPLGALVCYATALFLLTYYQIPPESILGVGEETIQNIYNNDLTPQLNSWHILAIIAITKIVLTSFTIISGGSAGMLIPSILVGAASTASLYHVLISFGLVVPSDSIYSTFVISGIASSLICVMDLPIATIIFIAEAFGRPYLPIALVSVMISRSLSHWIKAKMS